MKFANNRRGALYALGAALLFGASPPLAKTLVGFMPAQLLAGLLYLGTGASLLLYHLVRRWRSGPPGPFLHGREWRYLAGSTVFGGVLAPLLLMVGVSRTPSSVASLLLNLEAALTALVAAWIFGEHVSRRTAAAIGLILAGSCALSWSGDLSWAGLAGPLAVAGSCLSWAADNNLTRKIAHADPVRIGIVKGLAAGAGNAGVALWLGARWPEAAPAAGALLLGAVCYGASLMSFILALRALGAARTGAYFSVAPFVGAAAGVLFWKEPVTIQLAAAGALMALGVAVLAGEESA